MVVGSPSLTVVIQNIGMFWLLFTCVQDSSGVSDEGVNTEPATLTTAESVERVARVQRLELHWSE